ncbi:MAG: hydrogenase formation protein HypD [Desulfobacteraceae bacterium]|nr:hydrogenase formation protein HypD [Desulfobacteraceae bacterium]
MKYAREYRDPELCRNLADRIKETCQKEMRIMEVCGTHTVSIFRHGIRSLLPEHLSLISGPGCPVCVTDQKDLDAFMELANRKDVITATFGDLMRVPGSDSSLQGKKASGSDIRVVYSTMGALDIARANPSKQVVFLGIGFETTAPTVSASVLAAKEEGLENYSVYCAHKLVPPALEALVNTPGIRIDGFLLPGHVSVVIGENGYREFFDRYGLPSVIAGFEPVDIMTALLKLTEMITTQTPALKNAYTRAVSENGNTEARRVMETVFKPCDAVWRGLGEIKDGGLSFRPTFADFNACEKFEINVSETVLPKGCACGDILTGRISPPECRLYGRVCTPLNPVGPCMVSSEGACAAYYKYKGPEMEKRGHK